MLLVSGGHCLLAVAKNVDEFLLLGESVDSAPGEVLDKVWFTYSYRTNIKTNYMFYFKKQKVARRLKLRNMPAFSTLSGGKAIEMLATQGDVTSFEYGNQPMFKYNDW